MQEEQKKQVSLISLKQAPIIDSEGMKGISELIDRRIKALDIENQVATLDTVKSLKEMRSMLNKEFKTYEEQRKAVKAAIAAPYTVFEQQYKPFIAEKYQAANEQLGKKILSVEGKVKENKTNDLKAYFIEYCQSKEIDFLQFEKVGLNVTLSASIKSLKDQINTFVDGKASDLETIKVLPEDKEFKTEVLVEYKSTLDINHSIKAIQDRRAAKAELLKQQEERRQENSRQQAPKPEPKEMPQTPAAPLSKPTVEQPNEILEATFTVRGTLAQLKALKTFISENNIELISQNQQS